MVACTRALAQVAEGQRRHARNPRCGGPRCARRSHLHVARGHRGRRRFAAGRAPRALAPPVRLPVPERSGGEHLAEAQGLGGPHIVGVHLADELAVLLEAHELVGEEVVVGAVVQQGQHRLGDAHVAGDAVGLDGVAQERVRAEDVVTQLLLAYDPRRNGAVVDADAHAQGAAVRRLDVVHLVHHVVGHLEHGLRVPLGAVEARLGALLAVLRRRVHVAHDDVRVADGLHLEEVVLEDAGVEVLVELLEELDHLGGLVLDVAAHLREARDV
mmetsp:Transcript_13058/g.38335  ORF Transcript_13058/g.38335 Transcript_13058/m.38335 type:complete len:271 (+) Transcript_13058:520-1332(+)